VLLGEKSLQLPRASGYFEVNGNFSVEKDMETRRIFISIIMLVMLSTSYLACADIIGQSSSNAIEGSYIVIFKKDAGLVLPANAANRAKGKVHFGEHSNGQSKNELASMLGTTGEVASIFETINAVHMKMDAKEAERLSRDKRVLSIEQDRTGTIQSSQANPGWGLDRLDSSTPTLDDTYNYSNTGSGRIIYILDSGLALSNPTVAAQFGGRASIVYDRNGGDGNDCIGHGTMVANIAGGNTFGIAKGATIIAAKVTYDCIGTFDLSAETNSFNWLAANALPGTIVNASLSLSNNDCNNPFKSPALEASVKAAHDAGIIVVVSAGNDGCNTDNYSPVNIPQAFVVGATNSQGLSVGQDRKADFSRVGWNISAFAPGDDTVRTMNHNGWTIGGRGTSFSAPYIAGIFAVACQAAGASYCNTRGTANLYTDLRNTGTLGTVTNTDGTPLTGATSRFIRQQW